MKNRNTSLYYLTTLITGGQFSFVWLFLMASDANSMAKNHIPRLKPFVVGFSALYVTYLVLVGYTIAQFASRPEPNIAPAVVTSGYYFTALLLMALTIMALTWFLILRVARFVRNKGQRVPGAAALLLLSLFFLVSLPLLQSRLNVISKAPT